MFKSLFCWVALLWFFTADGSRLTQINADVQITFLLGGVTLVFYRRWKQINADEHRCSNHFSVGWGYFGFLPQMEAD